ncbi:nucleotidyltransferase domain-containing protein [Candidatus Uhrbacteria bacterium]|nr:nucleotidyltransferase domain-containing protein [Candidatus Uhrbacteria bacterium]
MTMITFRSKITRKVLDYFFLNPSERQYGSALAHLIREDLKNVYRKLLELEREGILESEFSGRQRYFYLSKKYPLLDEVKKLYFASAGFEQELTRAVQSVDGVCEAYIFGSYAKNAMTSKSDIDLLIIGNHSELALQKKINPLQRTIVREINSISMTPQEFARKKQKGDAFIRQISNHPMRKIV